MERTRTVKIGELAQLCGVSQATIRYYVRIGMLIPDDSGSQYNFSQREYQDLQLILKMKQQRFNLKEIQDYLVLTRHSNLIEPDTIEACLSILTSKRSELNGEIAQLQQSVEGIDQEILSLSNRVCFPSAQTGVPLSALNLLVCPHCGRPLMVENALINGNYVYSGTLHCSGGDECCKGYTAQIDHGIVKTGNLYTSPYDRPDLKRGLYRDMVPDFSLALQKCYDYVSDELKKQDLHGKVILEANINGYFFLYHHLNLLPEDCVCIVTDKWPEMLEMYKSLIEQMQVRRNILYIADASPNLPLRHHCVDLHISYLSENEYQLYHKKNFADDAKNFFKNSVRIFGAYISFDRDSVSRQNLLKKYPECNPKCYQAEYLKEEYEAAHFKMNSSEVGYTLDSGTRQYSFACHVKGEALRVFRFSAGKLRAETDSL